MSQNDGHRLHYYAYFTYETLTLKIIYIQLVSGQAQNRTISLSFGLHSAGCVCVCVCVLLLLLFIIALNVCLMFFGGILRNP